VFKNIHVYQLLHYRSEIKMGFYYIWGKWMGISLREPIICWIDNGNFGVMG
jgi:hypothetical protein